MVNKGTITNRLSELKDISIERMGDLGLKHGEDFFYDGIYLVGVQNYGLSNEKSRVDAKMVVLPSIRKVLRNERIYYDFSIEGKSRVDIKFPTGTIKSIFYGSNQGLEILATDYFLPGTYVELLKKEGVLDEITNAIIGSIWEDSLGCMSNKLYRLITPTPSATDCFKRVGYNTKDISHAFKLAGFLENLYNGLTFKESIDLNNTVYQQMFFEVRDCKFSITKAEHEVRQAIKVVERRIDMFKDDVIKTHKLKEKCFDIYVSMMEEKFNQKGV